MIWACLISSQITATDMASKASHLAVWPCASHFASQNINTLLNLLSVQLPYETKYHIKPLSLVLLPTGLTANLLKNLWGYVEYLFQLLSHSRKLKLRALGELTRSFYIRERSNNVTANCYCNSFFHKDDLCCTSKFTRPWVISQTNATSVSYCCLGPALTCIVNFFPI